VSSGALRLVVLDASACFDAQAAGRYSLMSPAQVVVCWIGWPRSITDA